MTARYVFTPEIRMKISKSVKQSYASKPIEKKLEHAINISKAKKLNNPAKRIEVRKKISDTLKRKYASGEILKRKLTAEHINLLAEARINKGIYSALSRSKKLSDSLKKAWSEGKFSSRPPRRSPTFLGRHHSQDSRDKISHALKGRKVIFSDEHKRRIGESNRRNIISTKQKKAIGIFHRELWKNANYKEKMKKIAREIWEREGYRNKLSIAHINHKHTLEQKAKIGHKTKLKWQDKIHKEKRLKNIMRSLHKRPTSLEKQMISIINKNSLPYKYVGNGEILIGFKNPDFINTNGIKVCIEVANEFHHDANYPKDRFEHFKKYGWHCITFLINDLNKIGENQILLKILEAEQECKMNV